MLHHLYRGRFTYGTFEEVRALAAAVVVVALLLGVPVVILGPAIGIPRSTVFVATPIALLFMFSVRYVKRLYVELKARPSVGAVPTLVYGPAIWARRLFVA